MLRAEKVTGTTRKDRTEPATLLDFVRSGDTLVPTRVDRLARSINMLGVFAEFQTNPRRERQTEGVATAKVRGVSAAMVALRLPSTSMGAGGRRAGRRPPALSTG